MAHAHRVRGRARRASCRPRAGRAVRPHASGQGRRHRPRGARHAAAGGHERPVEGGRGGGALQPGVERGRRGDRGPDRLSPRAGAVLRRAERVERSPRAPDARGGACRRSAPPDVPPGLVFPRRPGAGVRACDASAVPGGGRPIVHAVRGIRVPPPSGHRDPLGVHGRGRLRAVHVSGRRAGPMDVAGRGDGPVRRHAVRPRRARRAPPRDGLSALRPGPVRVLDRARGRPRVGGRVRQGSSSGEGRRWCASGTKECPAGCAAS